MMLPLLLASCAARPVKTPPPSPHAVVVRALPGMWVGNGTTPLGDMPIGLDFQRDGNDLHARMGDAEMYLDFRFHQQDGRWLLTEEGKFPGVGLQKHTLAPVGDTAVWRDGDLEVSLELREPSLVFVTKLRGEHHSTFTLARPERAVSSR